MNPQNYNQSPQTQPQAQPVQPRPIQVPGQAYIQTQQAHQTGQMAPTHPMQTTVPQRYTYPGQPVAMPTGQPNYAMPGTIPAGQPFATQQLVAPAGQVAAPETPQVTEQPLSTQATLQFSELRDSLVIMKDGSFRAVVACQSINFDLMSETEREGVEYSYQNFLNSLTFTTQILIRSQKVDIGPYIERLSKLRRDNDNMLLGVLMDDYINFIDVLAQEANIMDKSFFIVIPYYGSADLERAVEQTKNFFKAMGKNKAQPVTRINRDTYNKAIDELNNRVETVISGLFQIGIQSVRLNTKELSQLFYNFNNPDTAVREPLVDFTKLATMYVKKGTKE